MKSGDQWQLEGDAAELYERYAARYILGPWAPSLVDIAGVRAGERVLDVACGTGAVARVAAERVGMTGHVTGLDLNAGMLAVARALPVAPGAPVEWVERSALDTGLGDHSFDVVLCQQGVQFFPNRLAALREMRRVLVPGGRAAFSVWRTAGIYNTAVGDALKRRVGVDVASRFCASRDAPTGDDLVSTMIAAGFQEVKLHVKAMIVCLPAPEKFLLGHLAATPIAPVVRALDTALLEALVHDVAHTLAPYAKDDVIAFPEEINIVTAVKGAQ